jgi:hypothetical protein
VRPCRPSNQRGRKIPLGPKTRLLALDVAHDNDWSSQAPAAVSRRAAGWTSKVPGRPPPPGGLWSSATCPLWRQGWPGPGVGGSPAGFGSTTTAVDTRARSNLVGPTFLAQGDPFNVRLYSDPWLESAQLSPELGGLLRPCPSKQPGPGSRQLVESDRQVREQLDKLVGGPLAPGRGVRRCAGCGSLVDRYDQAALRLADGWWHRPCWLQGSQERQEAVRSQREHVGRHRALAEYLLSQERWGGLPAVLAVGNLVASSSEVGADNDCYSVHKLEAGIRLVWRQTGLISGEIPHVWRQACEFGRRRS